MPYLLVLLLCLSSECLFADTNQVGCGVWLVLPPESRNVLTSERLALDWIDRERTEIPTCGHIYKFELGRALFERVGINYTRRRGLKDLNPKQWNIILEATQATVLVDISYFDRNAFMQVFYREPRSLKELKFPGFENQYKVSPALYTSAVQTTPFLMEIYNLSPNSIVFGTNYIDVGEASFRDGYKYVDEEEGNNSFFDSIASSTRLIKTAHSDEFELWDYRAQPSGSLLTKFQRVKFTLRKDCDTCTDKNTSTFNYTTTLALLAPTIDGVLMGHTPIGTFSLTAGMGAAAYYYDDNITGDGAYGMRGLLKFGFSYQAFINRRVFTYLSMDLYHFEPRIVRNRFIDLRNVWDVTFGIGWFFPELPGHLLRISPL